MDVSSQIYNSKNKNLNEGHDMDGSSSSLDNLPDSILRHILSLLPTKDAVSTSILSKRWQYLWTSIPNLEFHQGSPVKRMLFINFVERVLLLHDSSNIEEFSLTCDVLNDASRIDAWISNAVRHKVQKLNICLSNFEEPFVLPHCLFTCDSLTELKVEMTYILKLPPSICFSSLETLILKGVTFLDDHSTQQLFSGCPVLDFLWIDSCIWENLEAVCISAPNLSSLNIDEYDSDTDTEYEGGLNCCHVMIFGASLESFRYQGQLINDYCLYNSSSLVEAWIDVPIWCQRPREVAYRVNKLLRGLSSVNELRLSYRAVEVLDSAEELFAHLPIFNNLTDFHLSTGPVDFDCKALLNIFQNFPHLRSLAFDEGFELSKSCAKDWKLDPVPPCFLSHLKSIDVYDSWRHEEQSEELLHVVKILLKNARVLDRLYICSFDRPEDSEWREEINEQLLMLPKASKSCSVDLYEF